MRKKESYLFFLIQFLKRFLPFKSVHTHRRWKTEILGSQKNNNQKTTKKKTLDAMDCSGYCKVSLSCPDFSFSPLLCSHKMHLLSSQTLVKEILPSQGIPVECLCVGL